MECVNELCGKIKNMKGLKLNINNIQTVIKNLVILLINNEKYNWIQHKKQIIISCLYKIYLTPSNNKDKHKHHRQTIENNSKFIDNLIINTEPNINDLIGLTNSNNIITTENIQTINVKPNQIKEEVNEEITNSFISNLSDSLIQSQSEKSYPIDKSVFQSTPMENSFINITRNEPATNQIPLVANKPGWLSWLSFGFLNK